MGGIIENNIFLFCKIVLVSFLLVFGKVDLVEENFGLLKIENLKWKMKIWKLSGWK